MGKVDGSSKENCMSKTVAFDGVVYGVLHMSSGPAPQGKMRHTIFVWDEHYADFPRWAHSRTVCS